MEHISIARLYKRREEKKLTVLDLKNRKRSLMERIDSIENHIARIETHIENIDDEINHRTQTKIPDIEIACFGLDARRRRIYGGIITFPGVQRKYYKIVEDISFFIETFENDKIAFNQRIKESIIFWLLSEQNLTSYSDLSDSEKNMILGSIREIRLYSHL